MLAQCVWQWMFSLHFDIPFTIVCGLWQTIWSLWFKVLRLFPLCIAIFSLRTFLSFSISSFLFSLSKPECSLHSCCHFDFIYCEWKVAERFYYYGKLEGTWRKRMKTKKEAKKWTEFGRCGTLLRTSQRQIIAWSFRSRFLLLFNGENDNLKMCTMIIYEWIVSSRSNIIQNYIESDLF